MISTCRRYPGLARHNEFFRMDFVGGRTLAVIGHQEVHGDVLAVEQLGDHFGDLGRKRLCVHAQIVLV